MQPQTKPSTPRETLRSPVEYSISRKYTCTLFGFIYDMFHLCDFTYSDDELAGSTNLRSTHSGKGRVRFRMRLVGQSAHESDRLRQTRSQLLLPDPARRHPLIEGRRTVDGVIGWHQLLASQKKKKWM